MRLPITFTFLAFALSACIVVPIAVPPTKTTTYKYADTPAATPAPVSSKCATPARAGTEASRVIASVNVQRKAAGLAPVRMSPALMKVAQDPENQITIDLPHQIVRAQNVEYKFDLDPFRKHCLMNGLDDIGLTLEKKASIDAYEAKQKSEQPWLAA